MSGFPQSLPAVTSPGLSTRMSVIGVAIGIDFMEVGFVLHCTPHTPGTLHLSVQNGALSMQNGTLSMQNGGLSVQSECEKGPFCILLQYGSVSILPSQAMDITFDELPRPF